MSSGAFPIQAVWQGGKASGREWTGRWPVSLRRVGVSDHFDSSEFISAVVRFLAEKNSKNADFSLNTTKAIPNAVGNDTFCESLLAAGDGAGAISLQYHY